MWSIRVCYCIIFCCSCVAYTCVLWHREKQRNCIVANPENRILLFEILEYVLHNTSDCLHTFLLSSNSVTGVKHSYYMLKSKANISCTAAILIIHTMYEGKMTSVCVYLWGVSIFSGMYSLLFETVRRKRKSKKINEGKNIIQIRLWELEMWIAS